MYPWTVIDVPTVPAKYKVTSHRYRTTNACTEYFKTYQDALNEAQRRNRKHEESK